MKQGFLSSSVPRSKRHPEEHEQQQQSRDLSPPSRVPMVFKIDFTVDSDGNLRIYELGHHFSSNVGLEKSIENLMTRLRTIYKHIYVSGDYHEAMRIG
jgi:hypothetical protein